MKQQRHVSFIIGVLFSYIVNGTNATISNRRITSTAAVIPPKSPLTTAKAAAATTTIGNTEQTTTPTTPDTDNIVKTTSEEKLQDTRQNSIATATPPLLEQQNNDELKPTLVPESEASVAVVPPSLHSRPLVVLRTASFLMSVSGALVAFLPAPTLVNELGSTKATSILSIIQSSTALCEIFLSPALGSIIDSIGRKPIMLGAISSIAMSNFLVSANPHSVRTICASKFCNMISTAMHITTAQAVLSDVTSGSSSLMSSALGLQFALVSGGFFLGSFTAGVLAEKFGLSVSYGVSALGMTCAALLVNFGMPETLHPSDKIPFEAHETRKLLLQAPLSSTRLLIKRGKEVRILAILLMLQTFPKVMGDFFQIIAKTQWNLSTSDFSRFVGMFGIIGISSNAIGGYLVQKLGVKRFTILSTLSAIGSPLGATLFGFKGLVIGSIIGFLAGAQSLGITAELFSHASSSKSEGVRIPQGELAGERASLMALLKVIGPLWYSTIHIQGQKLLGLTTLPWLFNLVLIGITLVVSQYHLS